MLPLLRLVQEGGQRVHVAGRNVSLTLSQREHEHVDVARRTCETTYPGELGRHALDRLGREHVPDLPEQRTRAPDGHAEVVEELGVEIGAETGLVVREDA